MKQLILFFLFSILSSCLFSQTVSTLVPVNVGDDMHFAADGYIYSSHYGGNHFRKINPSTGEVDTILTINDNTIGAIEMDADLNIYTCSYDFGWVGKFNAGDNSITNITTGLSGPAGIVHDSAGNLFVATNQNHSIIKIYPNGTKETWLLGTPLFWPTGITIDNSDNLYVSNMFSGQIIRITPDKQATVLTTLPAIADQVPDVAYLIWSNERLFVCHFGNHVIYEVNPENGDSEIIAGTGAAGNMDGPALSATFQNPTGIVASPTGDTLFVTDGAAPNQLLRMIVLNTVSGQKEINALGFVLNQLFPNPVYDQLILDFSLEQPTRFSFQITDVSGKVHSFQKEKMFQAGQHKLDFELKELPSGQFILTVQAENFLRSFSFLKT
ncbi:MAG TPA: T9SS type A sorting domain-containing protein [Saprospiraceae bacterium]|nr:T9SS type A sorting domain-containing protein [Saprospiraceae bacterium]HMQ85606.1 T9SS type A sorting domain-containing protein [Saprospiraceae bacterium]